MDITIDADSVEVNTGHCRGRNLRVDLRGIDTSGIMESLFGDIYDYEKVNLILEQISINDIVENLEGNDREEMYEKLREEFE